MIFELHPIIDKMFGLYEKPRSVERFREYISTLQGDKTGDMSLPIGGFNPMAKDHILQKLAELNALNAEKIMAETLDELNGSLSNDKTQSAFKVVLNLADDLKGGWTNHYTADYDSKFKINALVNRKFCTPFFWTSENYTKDLVKDRTLEYAYRTIFWVTHYKIKTLKDHIEQETQIAKKLGAIIDEPDTNDFDKLHKFYLKNRFSEDYSIIFNFLYGDKVSKSLEYPTYGITGNLHGFDYARITAKN